MTNDKPMIASAELSRIVDDAALFACRDRQLPSIKCVHFESTAKSLVCVGTDRFTLGASVTDYADDNGEEFAFSLDLPQAKMVSALAKSCRSAMSMVSITLTPGRVTFDFLSGEGLTVPVLDETFPDWRKLIGSQLAREPESTQATGINPVYLARFGRVHNARRMIMRATGAASPIVMKIGDSFVGLLMPVRIEAGETELGSIEWLQPPAPPETKKAAPKRVRKPRKTVAA